MILIPNDILFEEVERRIADNSRVLIRLRGDSMQPMMHGDRDVVELGPPTTDDLRRGTVVLCRWRGRHILHRITAVDGDRLTLTGDGNRTSELISAADVVAVMRTLHRPSGRIVDAASFGWRMRSWLWMALRPIRRYLLGVYRRLPRI